MKETFENRVYRVLLDIVTDGLDGPFSSNQLHYRLGYQDYRETHEVWRKRDNRIKAALNRLHKKGLVRRKHGLFWILTPHEIAERKNKNER